jgi:hypothetical protein
VTLSAKEATRLHLGLATYLMVLVVAERPGRDWLGGPRPLAV